MIHRIPDARQKLDVAGLNEITVLIDRSETELTEVALNSWAPGLDGPPHAHEHKEQVFFVTKGRGSVQIGDAKFPAQPGDLFYVPAATIHQTINETQDRLEYFLYNGFLDSAKEGHASFADHIEKVKDTRRRQAESGRADAGGPVPASGKSGIRTTLVADGSASQALLPRDTTQRAEVEARFLRAGHSAEFGAGDKEETLLVVQGSGEARCAGQAVPVSPRHVVFVRRDGKVTVVAGPAGMQVISFGTVLTK
jgi:mannose-6-phosphate isomerase-like protein (cupin superfamily)